ncbi:MULTISPECIES: DMT family transporter [unclassified Kitasatospora]|uniref:DMT family transporter n=1 Tax=unclassified Kitasatospora TaxID=2633591 RepID=UPI0009E7E4C8|nr:MULTISPECIES: DMT family transporter [unclassified Kitasatospora]
MTANDSAIRPSTIAVGGGTALAALGVVSFSLSFPATVWALSGFGPWSSTGLRGLLAAVVAAIGLAAARAPLPARRHWPGLLIVAGGCVVGFPLLTTLALGISSTAHTAVVVGLLPLATATFAALRSGFRPSRTFWYAALTGAAVVLGFTLQQSGGALTLADLYLLGALAVCAAGYAEGGRLARELPGWQVIAWGVLAAAPVMAVTAAVAVTFEPMELTVRSLTGLAYIAAVSQFGGFVLWYRGMAEIGIPKASQLQLAQPLLTLGWAVLLLDETPSPAAPLAAIGVLACIAVTQRARS